MAVKITLGQAPANFKRAVLFRTVEGDDAPPVAGATAEASAPSIGLNIKQGDPARAEIGRAHV